MSFQRVLEFARERGLPLIVTDVAGREPIVVMPLAEYERLTSAKFAPPFIHRSVVEESNFKLEDIVESTLPVREESRSALPELEKLQQNQGLSLEDQFYLETLDEPLA